MQCPRIQCTTCFTSSLTYTCMSPTHANVSLHVILLLCRSCRHHLSYGSLCSGRHRRGCWLASWLRRHAAAPHGCTPDWPTASSASCCPAAPCCRGMHQTRRLFRPPTLVASRLADTVPPVGWSKPGRCCCCRRCCCRCCCCCSCGRPRCFPGCIPEPFQQSQHLAGGLQPPQQLPELVGGAPCTLQLVHEHLILGVAATHG